MGISYRGFQITPAGMVSLSKSYQTTADGERIGSLWNITIEGKFVPYKGSPNSSGVLYGSGSTPPDENLSGQDYMTAILRKQEALRSLFATEGGQLYVQGWNNGLPIYCNPRIKGQIEFPRGGNASWASIADYRVQLEADVIYSGSGTLEDSGDIVNYHVESAEENWAIEPQDVDVGTYRLTHEVTAKGKRFYSSSGTLDQPAWKNARDYVLNSMQLGLDNQFMYATGILNNSNLNGYNYVRTQRVNEKGGTFTANETWLCYNPGSGYPAIDTYEVDTRIDMNGTAKVSLKGKIEGLAVSNNTTNVMSSGKYLNAYNKFYEVANTFLSRASGLANVTLNPTPVTRTYGTNPITGVITYNYEYDNRPLNNITDAVSENVSISFDYFSDIFAAIPVLGRAAGPVLQHIQTISTQKKTVVVEAIMPSKTMTYSPTKPDTNSLVSGYAPSATWVFKDTDRESWSQNEGRYTRTVVWSYNN